LERKVKAKAILFVVIDLANSQAARCRATAAPQTPW